MLAKRTFDILFSVILLIICLPIFLVIAILIKTTSPGPIFYPARRIQINRRNGDRRRNLVNYENDRRLADQRKADLYGKIFCMLKFRTMVQNAEKLGPSVTAKSDPRITKIGALLRRTKLDELPSLWNVFKGEMSFVGPRPETPDWIKYYSEAEKAVLKSKPGITGNAQIKYRNEQELLQSASLHQEYLKIMRDKLSIDLHYIQNWTFTKDFIILSKTVLALFSPLIKVRTKLLVNLRMIFSQLR
jgi:lipopolysaccharide/colanic/teichoic acid biosynthesis glycosyltransferase